MAKRPQLVLSIVVDGLRADYLEMLSECFGPDGFNRLMSQGVVLDEVDYGPGVDAAGAVAMIYTGASPAVNGIQHATVYSTDRKLEQSALLDPSKIGNYTNETLSPSAIRVSTLGDELRIDGAGASYVHAIAPDAAEAIIMAGHSGNSAFWINNTDGRWSTTTHYRDVPTPVQNRNFRLPLSRRIDTISWTPSMPLDRYPALPAHKRHYPFNHTFTGTGAQKYRLFKTAAPANTEVTRLAADYLHDLKLGQRDALDMLSVAYTLEPYAGSTDTGSRLETMDAYLRLDRELATLLKAADTNGNTVVILAGTPADASTAADPEQWKGNAGEFSARKAVSLLNMYLIASEGNGDWVTAYHNGGFYLNQKLIEQKKLNAEHIRTEAAKFLTRMSGVAGAYTIDDILEGRTPQALKRNTVVAHAPDVFIEVTPGWTLTDDTTPTPTSKVVRMAPTVAPVIIMAPNLTPRRISTPVDARRIAPSVARVLRIRSPNGASQPPVSEIFHK